MADKEDIQKILEKLSNLQLSVNSINQRVDRLESQEEEVSFPTHSQNVDPTVGEPTSDHIRSNSQPTILGPSAASSSTVADIQRDFERVRDSLQRTPVPDGYRVHDSAVGIKQECKQSLRLLSKCARYAETSLKIVNNVSVTNNTVNISEGELNCLFTCLAAQINYLQNEFTSLVVKSTFDEETARIFKQFENNSSTFSDNSLRNIRVAAELSTLSTRQARRGNPTRGRNGRGNFRSYRGWRSDFAGRNFNARPPINRPENEGTSPD